MTKPNESSSPCKANKNTSPDREQPPPRVSADSSGDAPPTPAPASEAPPVPPQVRIANSNEAAGSEGATRLFVAPARRDGMMAIGGGIRIGGGGGGGGAGAMGVVPQGGRAAQRRKIDFVAPHGRDPVCSVCGRNFASWKALFGHMRSHPERQWRGCYPPPLFDQELPPLNLGVGRSGLMDIDLNQPHEMEEAEGGAGDIDLNEPPAKDKSK